MTRLIAITGGIGAGKSVVSNILRTMGYDVYDTDFEAKRLMDNDPVIKQRLCSEISPDAVSADGVIDRRHISSIVFADSEKLQTLNAIVHRAVIDDITGWRTQADHRDTIFVETAILYQSGLDHIVDEVWEVIAPEFIRIQRVMSRNNCSREEVIARIEAQNFSPAEIHDSVNTIVNDNDRPILPQITRLLKL